MYPSPKGLFFYPAASCTDIPIVLLLLLALLPCVFYYYTGAAGFTHGPSATKTPPGSQVWDLLIAKVMPASLEKPEKYFFEIDCKKYWAWYENPDNVSPRAGNTASRFIPYRSAS